jgi:hypothetical protein
MQEWVRMLSQYTEEDVNGFAESAVAGGSARRGRQARGRGRMDQPSRDSKGAR